jgi:hypothetical protein
LLLWLLVLRLYLCTPIFLLVVNSLPLLLLLLVIVSPYQPTCSSSTGS